MPHRTAHRNPPLHRAFTALLMVAVLLQMGYVSVSYASCSSKGTQRIAFGELKSCCTPDVFPYTTLSSKCCDTDNFETVFFTFKEKEQDARLFAPDLHAAPAAPILFAARPLALRHVEQHLKIPPAAGRELLALHARLNV